MIEIKHKITKEVIYTYIGANLRCARLSGANLSCANLSCADLSGANLSGADLRDANLRDANLRDANLRDANLRCADLSGADLSGANLSGADLRDANLRDANLRDANLRYCIGNNKEVKSLQIGTYLISYTKYVLNIGCQSHTIDKWKYFTDEEIDLMDSKALDWWKLNKSLILELVGR